ncbi:hypothetical protein KRX57_08680 [Weeksellaceae bacterium TAE3-ERU29]|nr:hypothetical protein [Weeksellaceae bacterium TAE3-ERU29]
MYQLQWRIKGKKLSKEKVIKYLSSDTGKSALRESISFERAKQLFPDDLLMLVYR